MSTRHYCGLPGLKIDRFFAMPDMEYFPVSRARRHVYYTHKARCGLGLLCRYWCLGAGDQVLMPAYNCGTEIDPFICHGLDIVFYRVDCTASIDIQDIFSRINSRTKVIYIIHYFGWPQDVQELSVYCKQNGIYLIEDCALSLFSNPAETPIGILGDASVYSFPKTLPVPDGGALMVSDDIQLSEIPELNPSFNSVYKKMRSLMKRSVFYAADKVGLFPFFSPSFYQNNSAANKQRYSSYGLPEMPESYYYDGVIEQMKVSAITWFILRRTCRDEVVRRRRDNYTLIYNQLKGTEKYRPLYGGLPEGVCPLYMPIIVENRDVICKLLGEKGIQAIQWWGGYHRAFNGFNFSEARYMKDHLLALPIHQQLNQKQIDHIVFSLKELADQS